MDRSIYWDKIKSKECLKGNGWKGGKKLTSALCKRFYRLFVVR